MFRELVAQCEGLSSEQLDRLEEHYNLLLKWNKTLNLTRLEDVEDAARFHYCESLFLAKLLPRGVLRIADIGSGAGFPGVPLAVWRPESTVDLVESHQRKAVFLREATRALPNIQVRPVRGEFVQERYDWLVSRAVRPSEVLALKIAPKVSLLISESDLIGLAEPIQVERLPWGRNRIVAMFHVKQPDAKH